ncbi:NADP-dependent oxidoreductase [Marinilabilia rubra]|nr:NADP-dependent oxidoreductase [Marinilabilia rubra]
MNKTILLNSRPVGKPKPEDFKIVSAESEKQLSEGEMLLKTMYVSVDPYLRGRMTDADSYIPSFELNHPIESAIVAEVLGSENKNFSEGDIVTGLLDWKKEQISDGKDLMRVDPDQAPLSAYLGVLGMTGLTAYLGLMNIGKPKKDETLVVSGAAGAVGSIVGQIGKILGLHVVGIAGSDEKNEMLKQDFGFDETINYKTTQDITKAIADACPKGVDVYFDNVGGSVSDAVMFNINNFARIVNCGAISLYNATEMPHSISVQPFLIQKRALMQGFIVMDYASQFPEAIGQLSQWLKEKKLNYTETVVEGFDNIPQAFIDLFDGKNKGKMVVKV